MVTKRLTLVIQKQKAWKNSAGSTMAHEFYKNQGYVEKKSQKIFIKNV